MILIFKCERMLEEDAGGGGGWEMFRFGKKRSIKEQDQISRLLITKMRGEMLQPTDEFTSWALGGGLKYDGRCWQRWQLGILCDAAGFFGDSWHSSKVAGSIPGSALTFFNSDFQY